MSGLSWAQRKAARAAARTSRPVECGRPGCHAIIDHDHVCPACRAEFERLHGSGEHEAADAFLTTLDRVLS